MCAYGCQIILWQIFICSALSPLIIVILRIKKLQLKRKRKEKLEAQFKDMLMGMADAMSAGASSVTALKESYKEMLGMHGYNRLYLPGIKDYIIRN